MRKLGAERTAGTGATAKDRASHGVRRADGTPREEAGEGPEAEAKGLLARIVGGDRLAYCIPLGWHLVSDGTPVSAEAADLLHRDRPWGPSGRTRQGAFDFEAGRLAPLDDGLPGFGTTQTWVWAKGPDAQDEPKGTRATTRRKT